MTCNTTTNNSCSDNHFTVSRHALPTANLLSAVHKQDLSVAVYDPVTSVTLVGLAVSRGYRVPFTGSRSRGAKAQIKKK